MKQRITLKQINELNEHQLSNLDAWWNKLSDKDRDEYERTTILGLMIPLLSIGQMIEFLDGKFINFWRGARKDWLIILDDGTQDTEYVSDELADCLWQACKEVLNK